MVSPRVLLSSSCWFQALSILFLYSILGEQPEQKLKQRGYTNTAQCNISTGQVCNRGNFLYQGLSGVFLFFFIIIIIIIIEVFSDQVTSCPVSETNNVASGKPKREPAILMKSTAILMKLTHKNNRSNRSPRSENPKRQQSRTPLDPTTQVLSLQNMGYNGYNP